MVTLTGVTSSGSELSRGNSNCSSGSRTAVEKRSEVPSSRTILFKISWTYLVCPAAEGMDTASISGGASQRPPSSGSG